jgi:serine/threonine-protein kinase
VHRNVDPRGIVVSRDGRVVLLDFGMAKEDKPVAAVRFEPNDEVHGHRYTAPERIMGEPATPMSDVFSLGVVLYEMLCGQGPWDEGKPTPMDLSRRIRSEEPTPLSVHGVRIPRELSHILSCCLSKRAEERYEDGSALATALENALDSLSTSPVPVLVTRALDVAGLGEVLVDDKVRRRKQKVTTERPLRHLAGQLAGLLALVVVGAVVIEGFMGETNISSVSEEHLNGSDRGFLRVLARPWAEVFVDGRMVDVTPMAKPIVIPVGRHYVTFKHPNAPDEQREIVVTAGQSVLVDVTMRIERQAIDAGVDAAADAALSP